MGTLSYTINTVPAGGYAPNGNLLAHSDSVMGDWGYQYDTLNRLTSAAAGAAMLPGGASQPYANLIGCWSYDAFGNRTAESWQATTACPSSPSSLAPTAKYNTSNQVTWTSVNTAGGNFTYDAAGNVTNDGANKYLYDADGARVAKGSIAAMSCNPAQNGFSTTNDYILGLGGEQVTEMGIDANPTPNPGLSTGSFTISGSLIPGMSGEFLFEIKAGFSNAPPCMVFLSFAAGATPASLAAALARQLTCGGLISASNSAGSAVVTFTSTTTGPGVDYAISASLAGCNCSPSNPTTGLSVSASGAAMTGGSTFIGVNGLAWQHTNLWAGGKLLGTYDKIGLHFYFDDPLGTRRAQTDAAGVLEQTCTSLPYGDQLSCTGGDLQAPTEHHFTGKERDTESGNDYFGARYYASSMGRWLSPDPKEFSKQRMVDPQQWDMYSYTRNNPLLYVDPNGKDLIIYYSIGKDLSFNDRQLINDNLGAILSAIQAKFERAGVKNVKMRDLSTLSAKQIAALDKGSPFGVGRLEITGNTYDGKKVRQKDEIGLVNGDRPFGNTSPDGKRISAIFLDNFFANPEAGCNQICAIANVGAHELGHGQGLDHPWIAWLWLKQLFGAPKDLMEANQSNPSEPREFDTNSSQVKNMVDKLNKTGDNTPSDK